MSAGKAFVFSGITALSFKNYCCPVKRSIKTRCKQVWQEAVKMQDFYNLAVGFCLSAINEKTAHKDNICMKKGAS